MINNTETIIITVLENNRSDNSDKINGGDYSDIKNQAMQLKMCLFSFVVVIKPFFTRYIVMSSG